MDFISTIEEDEDVSMLQEESEDDYEEEVMTWRDIVSC